MPTAAETVAAMDPAVKEKLVSEVRKAADVMKRGGIVLYPTDTVWGIGCDATNQEAVEKIYRLKRRSDAKSMIVLVENEMALQRTLESVPEVAWDLVEAAVKPVTVIYDHPKGVAPNLLAPDGSLGIRLTREPFSNYLCGKMRVPVVSTSANISGEPTPRSFGAISPEILEGVDYVVDFRREETKSPKPSAVIKLRDNGEVKVIR